MKPIQFLAACIDVAETLALAAVALVIIAITPEPLPDQATRQDRADLAALRAKDADVVGLVAR